MFETGVVPILDYSSGVWNNVKQNHSDIIQNKAIRYYMGVHNFTPVPAIQGDMGWLTCKYRKQLNMVRFWNRLIKMPDDRLTKQVFLSEYDSIYQNWTKSIKTILRNTDLIHYFNDKLIVNLDLAKQRLVEINENEWRIDVARKPKLRTYVQFKFDYMTEEYLSKIHSRYERSLLAKLRCGVLPLAIETGRFNNVQLQNRKCEICCLDEVENEKHFVCECPGYETERLEFYHNISMYDNDNISTFKHVMQSNVNILCKYIRIIWTKRLSILNATR